MNIKKGLFLVLLFISYNTYSQNTANKTDKKEKKKNSGIIKYYQVQSRSRDHLILQMGYMNWRDKPDSIFVAGFNRQFKMYGMTDFLIKGFPYLSVGIGAGFGWDNVYFKNTKINLSNNSANTIAFANNNKAEYYDKSKITTFYFEVPLEIRVTLNPTNYNRSWKMALGLTYGYLLQAYSKGVSLKDASGTIINTSKVVERNSQYFNSSKILVHGRIGWGFVHLYGNYQLGSVFSASGGPDVSSFAFGIGISGL